MKIHVALLVSLVLSAPSLPVYSQEHTDEERAEFYKQCLLGPENNDFYVANCCDHLTVAAAELVCACASSCAAPKRKKAYKECVFWRNKANKRDAQDGNKLPSWTTACCDHLTDGDAQSLGVCRYGSG
ncbi:MULTISPECIES: hypothetical protein [Leisingera]|jgi:predicted RecA/RadA family phage recombinase|uniref:hypothetical protein n=1 Tax=Leisingera TaxID=191028 RepID=UPI00114E30DC|nr:MULTISPECIES: hypothetical protein [Leisingera]QDI75989.1 hypothetical protein R2C4_09610 [Leisingera aquaemixtae]